MEYREKFRLYASLLRALDPTFLRGAFVNDLKNEICAKLRFHRLKSLIELTDMALLVDERNGRKGASDDIKKGGPNYPRERVSVTQMLLEEELGTSEETTEEEEEIQWQGQPTMLDYKSVVDGVDIVLGMDWLRRLGTIKANLEELTMRVKVMGEKFVIKGNLSLIRCGNHFENHGAAISNGRSILGGR
ncbi:hypothetical protein CR513_30470, partial [Mucuna pruriens]